MLINNLNKQTIETSFNPQDFADGNRYYLEKRVEDFQLIQESQKREVIRSVIRDPKEYSVKIELENINSKIHLWGTCSCPLMSGCKHVIATLLTALDKENTHYTKAMPDPKVVQWMDTLDNALSSTSYIKKPQEEYRFIYLLNTSIYEKMDLTLKIVFSKRLKSGKWSTPKSLHRADFFYNFANKNSGFSQQDLEIFARLEGIKQISTHTRYHSDYLLQGEMAETILKEVVQTGRCYWLSTKNPPLTLKEPKPAQWHWEKNKELQTLHYHKDNAEYLIFAVENYWYFNEKTYELGLFQTDLSKEALKMLLTIPPIPTKHAEDIANILTKYRQALPINPPKVPHHKKVKSISPTPCLFLYQATIFEPAGYQRRMHDGLEKQPAAILTFDYQGIEVTEKDTQNIIEGTQIQRNIPKEVSYIQELTTAGWESFKQIPLLKEANKPLSDHYLFDNNAGDILKFSGKTLPELRKQGWRIEVSEDYPFHFVEETIDEWYSAIEDNLDSNHNYDWFGLELGITVKGEKINLLPVLQRLLPMLKRDESGKIIPQSTESVFAQLADGRYIPLPAERIHRILNILIELYDEKSLNDDEKLRLSNLHAMRLLELEEAMGAAQLRWFGGERLREMAKKLSNFKGITTVQPPSQFQGELRPYQIEGLSWLQFLREYNLSGILADDMGLGKTVQALSHILLEKISGRMTIPSLIAAPTSLMFNWHLETKRFAPDLKILVLHGSERKQVFDNIHEYDLILTTYSLLVRDKEILLKQPFYFFILDEAQFIKNAKTQAAQIALKIQAKHRLCLTGTPMENHLGELWSLFHFMMPGLLGDPAQFTRLFRTPIEKHGDQERRTHLNRRIAPFMLRRTKDKVITELPEKVETIHYVELDGPQRDLYETIRLTMQKKVRSQIAQLGLGRSHIIILEALLKLRQVCCDPRLLKIPEGQKNQARSAKLELLMNFITELLEEGRRILLFSQFTEMLGLIEEELHKKNIDYVKLTGKTKDRQTPVQQFQEGKVSLFLISLKAGGTGLNLTAADTVIHYDPWWNPAVENQATDRAHRIGQKKTVFVYKFVAKGTVEEKILDMQQQKHTLLEGLFSENTSNKLNLTEKDLQSLFDPL